jgi:hypothetical protein
MAVPTSLPALHTITAAELQAILDQLNQVWVDYTSTFTLTASTTNPTKGAGTVYKAERLLLSPKCCKVRIGITIGAGFAAGSGDYRFSLPFAAVSASTVALGVAWMLDNGTAYRIGRVRIENTAWAVIYRDDSGGPLGSSGPGSAWATGDKVELVLDFEPA